MSPAVRWRRVTLFCMYVPTLAEAIVKAQRGGTWAGAPLVGIAVGNGCSGSEVGVCSQNDAFSFFRWAYLTQTAFMSSSTKTAIASTCNWTAAAPTPAPACQAVLQQAAAAIAHVNLYNVYGDCISGIPSPPQLPSIRSSPSLLPRRLPRPRCCRACPQQNPGPVLPPLWGGGGWRRSRRLHQLARSQRLFQPQGRARCTRPPPLPLSRPCCKARSDAALAAAIHVRAPGFCWSVCR